MAEMAKNIPAPSAAAALVFMTPALFGYVAFFTIALCAAYCYVWPNGPCVPRCEEVNRADENNRNPYPPTVVVPVGAGTVFNTQHPGVPVVPAVPDNLPEGSVIRRVSNPEAFFIPASIRPHIVSPH